MTIPAPGGAGYIGSQTVRVLRERGESMVVLDRPETGHREANRLHPGDGRLGEHRYRGRIGLPPRSYWFP